MTICAFSAEPFQLLMAYVKLKELRLWDLFMQFDRKGSMTLSREEFREGIRVTLKKYIASKD